MVSSADSGKYVDQLRHLLETEERALYSQLGEALAPRDLPAESTEELIARARKWVDLRRGEIAQKLCPHPLIRQYRDSARVQDRTTLLAGLVDFVAAHFGIVPPATLLAILAKEGIESFCSSYPAASSDD